MKTLESDGPEFKSPLSCVPCDLGHMTLGHMTLPLCPYFLICKMRITTLFIVRIKLENLPKARGTKRGPLNVAHVSPCPECHCSCRALCLKRPPPRPLLAPVAPVCSLEKGVPSSGRPSSHSPPQRPCAGHTLHTHAQQLCPLSCSRFSSPPISHGAQAAHSSGFGFLAEASLILPWLEVISLPPSFLPSPHHP